MDQINVFVLMLLNLDGQKIISNYRTNYEKFGKKKKNEDQNCSARNSFGYFVFQIDELT